MSTPEQRWWTVRAGEYVLGTLRGEDRALFERILAHDTTMQQEVATWERQLAGLNHAAKARSPGDHVWPQILERVRQLDEPATGSASSVETGTQQQPLPPPDADTNPSTTLEAVPVITPVATSVTSVAAPGAPRASRLWPVLTGLATAASLVLAVLLFQRLEGPMGLPLSVDGLAVVLSDESGEPFFLVETDYGNLRVRVTALSPPTIDGGRDFQLWQALPDRSAVRPVALLPEQAGASVTFEVDSLIDGSDLFGVSIEPVGAPTDAGPTGPVVAHGDYLPRLDAL